jgi:hypothetical protein
MSEEKKEPWLNYLALTTVILAVCATLSTFKGGGYSTKSVISQAQASDQWAYFQAKGIKANLYEIQKENLQLQMAVLDAASSPAKLAPYQAAMAKYEQKIEKYTKEKAEIEKVARDLEEQRDDAKKHGQPFGFAVILLQIAILLCSIAALMKKRVLWYLGMPVGIGGLVFFANGFLLFM